MIIKNPLTIKKAKLQAKIATPTTSSQTIVADSNYDGLSEVQVEAVTSSIDSNIKVDNIKHGVTVLGVTGGYTPYIETSPTILTLELPNPVTVRIFLKRNIGTIYWGDGSSIVGAEIENTHTYNSSGTYNIILKPGEVKFTDSLDQNNPSTTSLLMLGNGTLLQKKNLFGETSSSLNISLFLKKVRIGTGMTVAPFGLAYCSNAEIDISNLGTALRDNNELELYGSILRDCSVAAGSSGIFQLNESITTIPPYTFYGTNIKTLIITRRSLEGYAYTVLKGTNGLPSTIEKILIPQERLSYYTTATNWSSFASMMEGY